MPASSCEPCDPDALTHPVIKRAQITPDVPASTRVLMERILLCRDRLKGPKQATSVSLGRRSADVSSHGRVVRYNGQTIRLNDRLFRHSDRHVRHNGRMSTIPDLWNQAPDV